jgi:uncharacterized cupin superfamily protein
MEPINIKDPVFEFDADDPERYRCGMFRFGKLLGLELLGVSVYEIAPGQKLCPYHYEYGDDEALIVLEGTPTLRTPEGTRVLAPWDTYGFPSGPASAHSIQNDSDATARILMFSTVTTPAATVYPDSDKIGIWTGNPADDVMVRRTSRVDYYDGEPAAG